MDDAGEFRATAPILDRVSVASPCKASWDAMTGSEHVRFCHLCEKNVFNLSAMTRVDAERLVREEEGRLCVRFYRRVDGTVLTEDCPIGLRWVRRKMLLARGAIAALFALLFWMGFWFLTKPTQGTPSVGKMSAPQPTMGTPVVPPPANPKH